MSLLDELCDCFTVDSCDPPSTETEILVLYRLFGKDIPRDFLEFIRLGSNLTLFFDDKNGAIRIWGADRTIDMEVGHEVHTTMSGAFPIGDDLGSYFFYYLDGREGHGIYMSGFGNQDIKDNYYICKSLRDLLTKGEGIDALRRY